MVLKDIKRIIKNYFFTYPTAKLRVRHIERGAKVPLPSAIRYCKELEKEGITKKEVIAGVNLYSADRASKSFLIHKVLFNLETLYSSKLIEHLIREYDNPTIILFGSYSKGEDIEDSDIDIYLETFSNKAVNLEQFEKKLKRRIQLFLHKSLNDINNKELANNIINGIIINGFLEVFK